MPKRRALPGLLLGPSLLATACGRSTAAPTAPPVLPTTTPAAAPAAAPAQGWKRPMDVAPLPAEGNFQVISQTPWPGEKVRVFFLGAQF
jgi:hypothetical protein